MAVIVVVVAGAKGFASLLPRAISWGQCRRGSSSIYERSRRPFRCLTVKPQNPRREVGA